MASINARSTICRVYSYFWGNFVPSSIRIKHLSPILVLLMRIICRMPHKWTSDLVPRFLRFLHMQLSVGMIVHSVLESHISNHVLKYSGSHFLRSKIEHIFSDFIARRSEYILCIHAGILSIFLKHSNHSLSTLFLIFMVLLTLK